MPRGNGGVIGPANIPTTSIARGVWSLQEQYLAQRQGIWPVFSSADPYFEYTTLLLPGNGTNGAQNNTFLDGSTNNFTITRNGNTTQGTFSPFSQTGWGNYFDGTTDYLTTTTSSVFNFGAGDFTVECWFYANSIGRQHSLVDLRTTNTNGWVFYVNNTNAISVYDGTTGVTSTDTITAGVWNHIAWTRSGTSLRIYLNGSQIVSTTNSKNNATDVYATVGASYGGSSDSTLGYISNVRVVKGVSVYTGTFTPPTSPLAATQSAGTNISAITGTQTSLLTCQSNRFIDNSANQFTITRGGDTSVVAFSPFNPSASWSAATYGGSGYFDGSGDYLTAPDDTALNLSGDFTVESWVYVPNVTGDKTVFHNHTSDNNGIPFLISNASPRVLSGSGAWNIDLSSSITISANTWNHIAATRSGSTYTIWVNGVSGGTASSATNPTYSGGAQIGRFTSGLPLAFNGYIQGLRVIKGTAVYTGNFTPPSLAPLTTAGSTSAASYPSTANVNTSFASSATSLLLNFTNAGIYDATSKNDLETVGDAQISNTTAKFGSTSIKFDGTGDYLKGNQATTDLYTFSGDFTIETWVYSTSSAIVGGGYPTIFATSAFNGTGIGLKIQSAGGSGTTGCACVWYNNTQILTGTSNIADSAWHHVAVTRSGSTIRLFVDGTQQTSATNSSTFTCASGYPLTAADSSSAGNLTGYIQDLRITKGYARYTANFTAPTAAFPTL